MKCVELLNGIPKAVILACWRRVKVTSLQPPIEIEATKDTQQLDADFDRYVERLDDMYVDENQANIAESLDKIAMETFSDSESDSGDDTTTAPHTETTTSPAADSATSPSSVVAAPPAIETATPPSSENATPTAIQVAAQIRHPNTPPK